MSTTYKIIVFALLVGGLVFARGGKNNLKIETDKTVIPNANIFDKKSMRLKRGETKFVKASDIIPFTQQSSFYKPPDPPTPREQRRALKERNRAEKPNVAAIVYQIFVHHT